MPGHELPLSLTLHAGPDGLPDAPRIRLPAGEATLEIGVDRATAHLALPGRARSEQRWLADQVVRKLGALVGVARAEVAAAPGVDDDALLTIALDLHQRTHGAVTAAGRPEV